MINKIFVFESLESHEKKTGSELYNDILIRYNEYYNGENSDLEILFYEIENRTELLTLLEKISGNITESDEVILHFEAHGNQTGLVLCNEEQIMWVNFASILMEINKKTRNNLHLTMATCYGRYIYKPLEKNLCKTAPYKTLISASDTIYTNEILEDYSLFFQYLVKERNITEAFKVLYRFNPNSNFIYKDTEDTLNLALDSILSIIEKCPNDSPTIQVLESLLGINLNEYDLSLGISENKKRIKNLYLNKFLMKD